MKHPLMLTLSFGVLAYAVHLRLIEGSAGVATFLTIPATFYILGTFFEKMGYPK